MNKEWQGIFVRAGASAVALLVLGAGCAQLIGIEETTVTRGIDGSGGGGAGGQSGNPPNPGGMGGRGGSGGIGGTGAGGTGVAAGGGGGMQAMGACTGTEARCGATGREVCAAGQWQSMPCPLTEPACEASGACVLRGPALVQVPATVTTSFYIDATEVTVAQYTQFLLAKNGDVSGQPAECAWNTRYFDPNQAPNPGALPITDVDWCDARAYCAWAGKHLCGSIAGGPVSKENAVVANQSQWFLSCGGPDGSQYLNNNTNNSECNTPNGFSGLVDAGSIDLCVARYPGVFDLIGNAAEWIDSCSPGGDGGVDPQKDFCLSMGGGIYGASRYYCDTAFDDVTRDFTNETFGFRCCSG